MTSSDELRFSDSVVVDAPPAAVYDVVSDVTRTGEWSPVCRRAEWEEPGRTGEGARFLGHNDDGTRQWTTTSTVVTARPGEEFTWEVGQSFVRWSYLMRPTEDGSATVLTHAWEVLPALHGMYADKYGDEAPEVLARRTESAHASIPKTLASIKEIVERDAG